MKIRRPPTQSDLVLGWKVSNGLVPTYWLDPGAQCGDQNDEHLVKVAARTLGCHTAIIAQSGSGKSFFLGRLIEELLLRTKARCLILDPNADFRRFSEVVDSSFWQKASYDHNTASGFLPHERSRSEFAGQWSKVKIQVWGGPRLDREGVKQLQISWPSVSEDSLFGDLDPMVRSSVYHCHQFLRAIEKLHRFQHFLLSRQGQAGRTTTPRSRFSLVADTKRILDEAKRLKVEERKPALQRKFPIVAQPAMNAADSQALLLPPGGRIQVNYDRAVDRAVAAIDYISPEAERFYFGRAEELLAAGAFSTKVSSLPGRGPNPARADIIDLPSFSDWKTRLSALDSLLAAEWDFAQWKWENAIDSAKKPDQRVPTFVVVDEAHNLIPSAPEGLTAIGLRDRFRRIAAEGRKYGLFLIVCTQRPDKLDPLVLSECENRAIMKLGSSSVLSITKSLLGLEDVQARLLSKCLEFEAGRAVLIGRWSKTAPEILYTAMRRTAEGGKNLRADHWATPLGAAPSEPTHKEMSVPPRRPVRRRIKLKFAKSARK